MDAPNVTEFASQRYFDKLRQLREPKEQAQDNAEPSATQAHHNQHHRDQHEEPSTFILPIGRPRSPEHSAHDVALKDKRRNNFSLRSILPSRNSVEHDSRRLSTDSAKSKRDTFDQRFSALPAELKIQIVASLPLSDILNLRLVSRSWHTMVSLSELPITLYHIKHHIPAYAIRLYPIPDRFSVKLDYLCGLWHRLHVAAKLSYLISERVTKEMFLRTTEQQRLEFAPQHERMRRRLIPLLFTLFHFFETYRELHADFIRGRGHGLLQEPFTKNPIEVKIMGMYDDQTLLRVHQVFPLVISSFCRRLRPPSYAGRLERSLRGYLRDQPAEKIYVAALCLGGLRRVERFWEVKGYNSRRGAVDTWYNSIYKEQVETGPKPRRGFMHLSRKKSSIHLSDTSKAHHDQASSHRFRRSSDSQHQYRDNDTSVPGLHDDFIFNSSLAGGMPMAELSRDQLRSLLPDLPLLKDLWAPTAEALILERGIVERPSDIKRNGQILLDLIREDGTAGEDEWWYGQGAPDSVRPPLEAIEEDPIE